MFLYYIELRLLTLSITNYHTCRNNLKRHQLHGESGSADINAIENALPDLKQLSAPLNLKMYITWMKLGCSFVKYNIKLYILKILVNSNEI
jgi:hypothetical protein